MKKVAIAVAALAAWWCFGSPEEWFNPAGSEEVYYTAYFEFEKDDWSQETVEVQIDPATGGIVVEDWWWYMTSMEQRNALLAMQEALKARNSVGTLAESIKSLLKNGMILSGKDANGNTIVQRLTFSRGLNADGKPLEGSTDAIYDFADGKSIEYPEGTMPKLRIAGFDEAADLSFPVKKDGKVLWINPEAGSFSYYLADDHKIYFELSEFADGQHLAVQDLANLMTNSSPATAAWRDHTEIITRLVSGGKPRLEYIKVGELLESAGSVKVDGVSIATNEEGVVSLHGFDEEAGDAAIIQRDGVVAYARTVSANRYLGTPADDTRMGFWDLPNVTTNSVEGDEVTITTVSNDPATGIKRLGLMPPPEPSIIVNSGGYAAYAPLPEMETEMKVDGESIVTNEQGQVQLANWGDFVGSALPRFVTVQNGNQLAPYDFPHLDDGESQVGLFEIDGYITGILAGWNSNQANCTERICDMIEQDTDAKKEAADDHWVLTKNISTGNLHFTPFGTPSAKYGLRHAEGAGDVAVTETKMGDFVTNLVVRLKQNAREPLGTASAFVTDVNDDGEMVRSAVNFEAAENIGVIEQEIVTMGASICESWWTDAGTWEVITNKLDGTYCREKDCKETAEEIRADVSENGERIDALELEVEVLQQGISDTSGEVQEISHSVNDMEEFVHRFTVGEDGALYFDGRRLKFADE